MCQKLLCFDFLDEVYHLDGSKGAVVALVAGLCSGPLNGLLDVFGGEDAEHHGNLAGWWSREIDEKNRLIYKIEDGYIKIFQCKNHYADK